MKGGNRRQLTTSLAHNKTTQYTAVLIENHAIPHYFLKLYILVIVHTFHLLSPQFQIFSSSSLVLFNPFSFLVCSLLRVLHSN